MVNFFNVTFIRTPLKATLLDMYWSNTMKDQVYLYRFALNPAVVHVRHFVYGHVTRSSGLAKTILQGTLQGGRRRGRQKKEMGGQHAGMDWHDAGRRHEEGEKDGGSWLPGHSSRPNGPPD